MDNLIFEEFDYVGDPFELVDGIKDEKQLFFLDSSKKRQMKGRYSFIGFDPFDTVSFQGKEAPDALRKRFYSIPWQKKVPFTPLTSGVVGLLGYDFGYPENKIAKRAGSDIETGDCMFGFYDCVITVDHLKKKLYVTSSGLPEIGGRKQKLRAANRLEMVLKKIRPLLNIKKSGKKNALAAERSIHSADNFKSNFTKAEYCNAVQKALGYIEGGDIYQVNLSQRFELENSLELSALDLYRALRMISPSSFSGYFDAGTIKVVSSSPEHFLSLNQGKIYSRPMKGTRPRGHTLSEDKQLKKEIIENKKEKAELLMITDLIRNDLGKVCEFGSVKVKELRTVEQYSTVYQATSLIEGILRNDKDGFDIIKACFPGGSITGCPKLRAMEIIEELEPVRRGVYTGSLGFISFCGDMEFNILIRTILFNEEKIYFHTGSGIVADSDPEKEYEETMVKAKALIEAVKRLYK